MCHFYLFSISFAIKDSSCSILFSNKDIKLDENIVQKYIERIDVYDNETIKITNKTKDVENFNNLFPKIIKYATENVEKSYIMKISGNLESLSYDDEIINLYSRYIKDTSFIPNSILNIENIDTKIKYLLNDDLTENKVVVEAIDTDTKTKNTTELLKEVYNGTSQQNKFQAREKRNKLYDELSDFTSLLLKYFRISSRSLDVIRLVYSSEFSVNNPSTSISPSVFVTVDLIASSPTDLLSILLSLFSNILQVRNEACRSISLDNKSLAISSALLTTTSDFRCWFSATILNVDSLSKMFSISATSIV